jgi:hypothetical protein
METYGTFKKYYAGNIFLNKFFVGVLKVNDENSSNRIH